MSSFGFALAMMGTGLLVAADITPSQPSYNQTAAAGYLDGRESWWLTWPRSQRDHDTACVSCHTALPYALSRPALRQSLGEKNLTQTESQMLANVRKRVALWAEVEPFYKDESSGPNKSIESRTTEAVVNALILARYDAANGAALSDSTRAAFKNMWDMQQTAGDRKGAWIWLNFHNSPWEGWESEYWGATLAELALRFAPADYRNDPSVRENQTALHDYLQRNYAAQPLSNQLVVYWATVGMPPVLTPEQQTALQTAVFALQQADGGWSLGRLGEWKRRDNTPLAGVSDGYATAIALLAFESNGVQRTDPHLAHAIEWLGKNQNAAQGNWAAYSLNKDRDLSTDIGKLMVDAATGYSVIALEY